MITFQSKAGADPGGSVQGGLGPRFFAPNKWLAPLFLLDLPPFIFLDLPLQGTGCHDLGL
jgi:hypothetical protein